MIHEAAAELYRAAIGRIKQREKDVLSRKHQVKIARVFKAQKTLVLAEMGKYQYLFSESYRKLSEESPVDFTLQNWDRVWEDIVRRSTPELQESIAAAEADGLVQGAEQLKRLFNSKTTFNLANPRAVQFFMQNGGSVDRIRGIQQTTGDSIKKIVANAINTGQSYTQISKDISSKFDEFSRKRAQRIAVFETGTSYEQGNKLFAQSLEDDGVEMEESWVTSHDSLVRPEHAANEAEGWVPIGHLYSSGDYDTPTDPGCRCFKIWREVPK